MTSAKPVDQLGMDEVLIEDSELERAIEKHMAAAEKARPLKQAEAEAKDERDFALERHKDELEDGTVYRVGPFRISQETRPAGHRSFDTKVSTRHHVSRVSEA